MVSSQSAKEGEGAKKIKQKDEVKGEGAGVKTGQNRGGLDGNSSPVFLFFCGIQVRVVSALQPGKKKPSN